MPSFELPAIQGPPAILPPARERAFRPKKNQQLFNEPWLGYVGNPLLPDENPEITSGSLTRVYECIATNPVVKAAMDTRTAAVFASKYDIVSRNDYTLYPEFEALDAQIIREMKDQLDCLEMESWDDVLHTVYRNAWRYGFNVSNKVYGVRNGMWVIREIRTFASFLFDLWADETGNLSSVQYLKMYMQVSGDALGALAIGTWPYLANGNWYGESELLSVYQHVKLLEALEQQAAQGGGYLAIKPILHEFDATDRPSQEIKLVQAALAKAGTATVISLPLQPNPADPNNPIVSDRVRVLEDRASPEGMKAVRDMIVDMRNQITRTLGSPADQGLTTSVGGSYARAEEQVESVFETRVSTDQEWIVSFVNREITPDLIRFNHPDLPPDYRWPEFTFLALEDDNSLISADLIFGMIDRGGVDATEPWVREKLGMPIAPAKEGPQPVAMEVGKLTALIDMVARIKTGEFSRESAKGIMRIVYGMDEAQSEMVLADPALLAPVAPPATMEQLPDIGNNSLPPPTFP